MGRYGPLFTLAVSVAALYELRRLHRIGNNLYDPVLTKNERRQRNIRFAAFMAIYVAVALVSFFRSQ